MKITKYNRKKDASAANNGTSSSSSYSSSGIVAQSLNTTPTLDKHTLWGLQFDGTSDVSGDISNAGNIEANGDITVNASTSEGKTIGGNITADGNIIGKRVKADNINGKDISASNSITSNGNIYGLNIYANNGIETLGDIYSLGEIRADGDITSDGDIYANGDITATNANISNNITTKNLTVTGQAHFFQLVIDKIRSIGGAFIASPADGFDVDVVESVEGGYRLYWRQNDGSKERINQWVIGDQALCMNMNGAKVGTSHSIQNKYYWALVTNTNDGASPTDKLSNGNYIDTDHNLYNFIQISSTDCDGTVNPEVGDTIVQLGNRNDASTNPNYRGSAEYIATYNSLDSELTPPLLAQYRSIGSVAGHYYDLKYYRKSYFDAKNAKFVGNFQVNTGQSVEDYIADKIDSAASGVPYISDGTDGFVSGHWIIWDSTQKKYIDSGVVSKGENGKDGISYKLYPIRELANVYIEKNSSKIQRQLYYQIYKFSNNVPLAVTDGEIKGYWGNSEMSFTRDSLTYKVDDVINYTKDVQYIAVELNVNGYVVDRRTVPVKFKALAVFDVTNNAINMAVQESNSYTDGNITNVNNKISTLQLTADSILSQVANYSTPNKNYFGFCKQLNFESMGINVIPYIYRYGVEIHKNDSKLARISNLGFDGKGGKFVVSGKLRMTDGNKSININLGDKQPYKIDYANGTTGNSLTVTTNETPFVCYYELSDTDYVGAPYFGFLDIEGVDDGNRCIVTDLKIERGLYPTPFCIADEDRDCDFKILKQYGDWQTNGVSTNNDTKSYTITTKPASNAYIDYIYFNDINVKDKQCYSLSFECDCDTENVWIVSHLYGNGGIINGNGVYGNYSDGATETLLLVGKHKYIIHWYVYSAGLTDFKTIKNCIPVRFLYLNLGANANITFSNVTLYEGYVDDNINLQLNQKISNVQQTAEGIKTTVSDVSGKVDSLNGNYQTLNNKVTEINTTANGLSTRVSDINSLVDTLNGNINTLSSKVSEIKINSDSISTLVSKMIQPNRNYFGFCKNLNLELMGNNLIPFIASYGIEVHNNERGTVRMSNLGFEGVGGKFVVSGTIYMKNANFNGINLNLCDKQPYKIDFANGTTGTNLNVTKTPTPFVCYYNIDSSFTDVKSYNGFFDIEGVTTANYCIIENLKIERGEQPTAFCIAEEDLNCEPKIIKQFGDWETNNVTSDISTKTYSITTKPSHGGYINYITFKNLTVKDKQAYTLTFEANSDTSDILLRSYLYLNGGIINGSQSKNSKFGYTQTFLKQGKHKYYVYWYVYSAELSDFTTTKDCIAIRVSGSTAFDSANVKFSNVTLYEGYVSDSVYQLTYSKITLTAEEIELKVNDVSMKLNDGIELNGNTKINGNLVIKDEDTGFLLTGSSGTTQISPKSIGTYTDFYNKSEISNSISGSALAYGALYVLEYGYAPIDFRWNFTRSIGIIPKGKTVTFNNSTITFMKPNSSTVLNGSNIAFNVDIYEGDNKIKSFSSGTTKIVLSNQTYVSTGGEFTLKFSISARFNSAQWENEPIGILKMPLAQCNWTFGFEYPRENFQLIGFDGFALNFGNSSMVYLGPLASVLKYGDYALKLSSDGGIQRYIQLYKLGSSKKSHIHGSQTYTDTVESRYLSEFVPINGYNIRQTATYISGGTLYIDKDDDFIEVRNTSGILNLFLGNPDFFKGKRIMIKKTSGGGDMDVYAGYSTSNSTYKIIRANTADRQNNYLDQQNTIRAYFSNGEFWIEEWLSW